MVLNALTGNAVLTAMHIGHTVLLVADGMDRLMEAIRAHVFPQVLAEAKESYQVGHNFRGPMSRQSGEPTNPLCFQDTSGGTVALPERFPHPTNPCDCQIVQRRTQVRIARRAPFLFAV